jgi:hypothetical protein
VHRDAARAAVEVTNLVTKPGENVPDVLGASLLSHSHKRVTKDLAGNPLPPSGRVGYFSELAGASPAADAPPLSVRDHASMSFNGANSSTDSAYHSYKDSGYSSPRSPAPASVYVPQKVTGVKPRSAARGLPVHVSDTGFRDDGSVAALNQWQRQVAAWKQEMEECLAKLAEAIRKEDFAKANMLKARRDYLKSIPLPERPAFAQDQQQQQTQSQMHYNGAYYTGSNLQSPKGFEDGYNGGEFQPQHQDQLIPTQYPPVIAIANTHNHSGNGQSEEKMSSRFSVNSFASANTISSKDLSLNPFGVNNGRTDSGGIGFLFNTLKHNPEHTPKPDGALVYN